MLSGVGVNKFEHPVMLLPLKNIKWFLTLLIFAMQVITYNYKISSPGELPDPGIEMGSSALQADSLPVEMLAS